MALYQFGAVDSCNMCGAPTSEARVLGLRLAISQGRNPRNVRGVGVTILRCRRCDLIFADPQPVPNRLTDHYDMPGEACWSDNRATPKASPLAVERFSELRRRYPANRAPDALDVGVGSGFTALAIIKAGFTFRGCEPVAQFRELALTNLQMPEDCIALAGMEDVEYPAESFDLINFGAVLEHLYDPAGSLAKAMGWLRPGGRVILEVPSSNWLIARIINGFFRLRGTNYVTHLSPMHLPFHLYEFGAKSFALNGARLGYAVEELTIEVGSDPTMAAALQKLLRPIMAATGTGLMLHAALRKQ